MTSKFELFKQQIDGALSLIDEKSEFGQSQQFLPSSLDDVLDAPSLLNRCDKVCEKYKAEKPTIRVIHHLACSGGYLVAKYISSMPNVYLLNEVHPYLNTGVEHASSNLIKTVADANIPENSVLAESLFVEDILRIYHHVTKHGGQLVIRDNAFFDYLSAEKIYSKSIVGLLEKHFEVVSVVVYRDAIDAYASLSAANFFDGPSLSFNDYCIRAKKFVEDYSGHSFYRYEDLEGQAEKTVGSICEHLNIEYSDMFELFCTDIDKSSQFDSWCSTDIDCYNTKLDSKPSFEEVGKSEVYFQLQKLVKPKDKKIILVATMPRSGSTWLFNCVREVLKRNDVDFYSDWVNDYQPSNLAEVHIVKVHEPEHRLSSQSDIILSSRRDIRNVCVSLIRMGWLNNNNAAVLKQINHIVDIVHKFWSARAELEIEYQDILKNSEHVIRNVYSALGFEVIEPDLHKVSEFLNKLQSPKAYDKETQLHPEHRSTSVTDYSTVFDSSLISEINRVYHKWFLKYGYLEK